MNLVDAAARRVSAPSVSMRSRSVLGWIPAVVAGRMETVTLGTALPACGTGPKEEQHHGGKNQRKDTKPDQQLTGHVLSLPSFGSFTVPSA